MESFSDHLSSSSSYFSSNDCSTISAHSINQFPIHPIVPINPPHLYPSHSILFEFSTSYSSASSNSTYVNHNYPVVTRRGIKHLIYMDNQKKEQVNKTLHYKQLPYHPYIYHSFIILIAIPQTALPTHQTNPYYLHSQSKKFNLQSPLDQAHRTTKPPLHTSQTKHLSSTLQLINKVYMDKRKYATILPSLPRYR